MSNEPILPDELRQAAQTLEERFAILGVPTSKVPLQEWAVLDPKLQRFIPRWLTGLLANYSLVGGIIQDNDPFSDYQGGFNFLGPKAYAEWFSNQVETSKLFTLGQEFFPLSNEENGNLWITRAAGNASDPVYLWNASMRKRIYACKNIAIMLSLMEVSHKSFAFATERLFLICDPGY